MGQKLDRYLERTLGAEFKSNYYVAQLVDNALKACRSLKESGELTMDEEDFSIGYVQHQLDIEAEESARRKREEEESLWRLQMDRLLKKDEMGGGERIIYGTKT